ncbi:hypothetical protein M6B38_278525 [Iris pallida]|uniref:Uncharacterized protein n=1 Tax=Iris pallida TaxID=29817 RepID=A0AAX6EL99_IRIPA|nr:hypothetical protein M6B38_184420 [Iris pallida]KAJ6804720.1 hypothetical protein M6B38_184425 [Iris pallida]KAJ6846074.1 hypothetical protein M6B38_278525 [Iris pallida]
MQPFTSLHRFISRAFHSSLVLSADPSISPPASRVFHRSRVLRRLLGFPASTATSTATLMTTTTTRMMMAALVA